jgi:ADP-ribosylation factor GTPase-activating protein 1
VNGPPLPNLLISASIHVRPPQDLLLLKVSVNHVHPRALLHLVVILVLHHHFETPPAEHQIYPQIKKNLNESYFSNLGKVNENRPSHLPPSQGGRYTGFGSTPTPPLGQEHPSFGLSSANAPSLGELQENPVAALSKGWSLFTAAVVGATKAVSENVIQPGMEKVTDPNFQASVKGYMTEAQKKAAAVGSTANEWSKQQFGVDVADTVGGVVGTVKDKVGGGPSRLGYGSIALTSPSDHDESSGLYDGDDDDLFGEYHGHQSPQHSSLAPTVITGGSHSTSTATAPIKKNEWDDEWKDF